MRFLIIPLILCTLVVSALAAGDDASGVVEWKVPPKDLDANYPPKEDGMPYLNNMFALSVAMTGTFTNMMEEDYEQAGQWVDRVEEHYTRIGELVPAWEDRLDMKALAAFKKAVKDTRSLKAAQAAGQDIGSTCGNCHNDFEASANLMFHYRPYDFDMTDPVTERSVEVADYMKHTTNSYKHVAIYLADGQTDKAAASAEQLRQRMQRMPQMCERCHDVDVAPMFFGERLMKRLDAVKSGVAAGDMSKVQENLGWVGVNNCAKCHYVHRTPEKLRQKLIESRKEVK